MRLFYYFPRSPSSTWLFLSLESPSYINPRFGFPPNNKISQDPYLIIRQPKILFNWRSSQHVRDNIAQSTFQQNIIKPIWKHFLRGPFSVWVPLHGGKVALIESVQIISHPALSQSNNSPEMTYSLFPFFDSHWFFSKTNEGQKQRYTMASGQLWQGTHLWQPKLSSFGHKHPAKDRTSCGLLRGRVGPIQSARHCFRPCPCDATSDGTKTRALAEQVHECLLKLQTLLTRTLTWSRIQHLYVKWFLPNPQNTENPAYTKNFKWLPKKISTGRWIIVGWFVKIDLHCTDRSTTIS